MTRASRKAAYGRGLIAETVAALFLRLKGYRILHRRYKSPVGEIDIISQRSKTIAFVEVKARKSVGDALHSVTRHQMRRITKAAEFWISQNAQSSTFDLRFDVIVINPYRWPTHIEAAFSLDDM